VKEQGKAKAYREEASAVSCPKSASWIIGRRPLSLQRSRVAKPCKYKQVLCIASYLAKFLFDLDKSNKGGFSGQSGRIFEQEIRELGRFSGSGWAQMFNGRLQNSPKTFVACTAARRAVFLTSTN
jgi:hypothetical protein